MRIVATGISGGIGRAWIRRMQEHPDWTLLGLARSPEMGQRAFDVTWVPEKIAQAVSDLSSVDVLLCLAGADILSPPLRQASYVERLDALYQVDVAGTIKTIQAMLPHLGSDPLIITMGWDAAGLGKGGESGELYALAKGAVTSYSKSLALSLMGRATVYVVSPGWVCTRWGESLTELSHQRIAAQTRAGRWQTPDEVAQVLESLIAMPTKVLTGQVFYVNHGDILPS